MLAVGILKGAYPDLAAILRGKAEYRDEDIQPTKVNITKLFRYERQIGEGRYSSVWVVENRKDHVFYAMKKVDIWDLSKYERLDLSVCI